ncbi:MAG: hypothetical protein J6C23_04190 [Clostridia bacterium]|nr:hypothetical protein [Clostridia bacterium]
MLPKIDKTLLPLPTFTPQKWQTVILRNYGIVSNKTIASVLKTDEQTIINEAKKLGLENIKFCNKWQKLGYITIIRNNWHLLPYSQLIELLETDEATLDYNLREDDFLNVKLGLIKSDCAPVYYSPLTKEDEQKTSKIASLVRASFIPSYVDYFDFYPQNTHTYATKPNNTGFDRIVYSYSMLYGDTFLDGEEIVPDGLLAQMQSMGVNGIWMQGVLAKLSPYPFVEGMDEGYQIRRKNLNAIINKCKKYGIGVFLYFNEPRGLAPDQISEKTEKIKGRFYEERWSLCTTQKPVQDYLYNAVKDLVLAVPDLAGIITITMSENMTNCHSRHNNDCPFCKHLKHQDVVPEVNNIMQRAVSDAGVKTRIIANLWAWTKSYDWSDDDLREGIERMDKRIDVLSVSEMGTVIIDGKKEEVKEYSLSKVGPCEETKQNLTNAKKSGHKIMAKVQINNSWEFAVVPYVPVFELVKEHMQNLKNLGIGGLMMSWTLGGYPTVSLDLANKIFEDDFDYDKWLSLHFENQAPVIKQAVKLFSEGYKSYPYDIRTLYMGNQECGPSNLMYPHKTGYTATMVGFPFDDVNTWVGTHTVESYTSKLSVLLKKWEQGLAMLENVSGNDNVTELIRFAKVVYINLKSTLVQIDFNLKRENGNNQELLALINEELSLTKQLYELSAQDARIGYEASNHYYFTQNSFLEKLVNLEYLKRLYKN